MPSTSHMDVSPLPERDELARTSLPTLRRSVTPSTPRKASLDALEGYSGRSTMRNGAQRKFPSICESKKKTRSSFQCQIESWDLETSKSRIRDLLVSIAGKKTELQGLNCDLQRADTKKKQLVRLSNETRAWPLVDGIVSYPQDRDNYWQYSDFNTMQGLPDRFYPPFEFDGESEGTFKRSRSRQRGWSIVERKLFSANRRRSRSSSTWSSGRPQLTYSRSSSYSRATDTYSSEAEDIILHDFPKPPGQASKYVVHGRDDSNMSVATLMSNSTALGEISAVLEAKSMFLQRKTSRGPMLVQISPVPTFGQRSETPTKKRQSVEQRHSRRRSNFGLSTGKFRRRQSGYGVAEIQRPYTVNPMQSVIESPLLNDPNVNQNARASQHFVDSSRYSRHIDVQSNEELLQPLSFHPPHQHSRQKSKSAYGPPERIPPRTSSLYHDQQNYRLTYPQTYQKNHDNTNDDDSGYIDSVPVGRQYSLVPRTMPNPISFESRALSNTQSPTRSRKQTCLPKLCDRLFTKQPTKRKSGIQRLRARIRSLPLNPAWWRNRHSSPAAFTTSGGRVSRNIDRRSIISLPLSNVHRASSAFQVERAFTAMVESTNVSSNNSIMSPRRTIRAIHRESYISVTESSTSSSYGAPPDEWFTMVTRSQVDGAGMSGRYPGRLNMTSELDGSLRRPDARVMDSFLQRPATHRHMRSLAELA